jgi:hypothetical protein
MDAAREAARMRFVHDSQPPAAAPSPKAESVPSPPPTDPYDDESAIADEEVTTDAGR